MSVDFDEEGWSCPCGHRNHLAHERYVADVEAAFAKRKPAKPKWQLVVEQIEAFEGDDGVMLLEPRDQMDKCLLGLVRRFNSYFAVYSQKCVLEALAEDADTDDPDYPPDLAAREWFEFNTIGAWVGEGTPAFMQDEDE